MRLLLVEDNRDILANLADYLALKGYEVDCAQDGLTGLHLAATQHYDLIVLDVMLPGMDGFTLCQRLRDSERSHVPVIMLTARDTLDDRLQGFRTGADDYLTKPFALSELTARIAAVLKRTRGGGRRVLSVADLEYDLDTLAVRVHSLAAAPNLELMLGSHFDRTPAPTATVTLDQPTFRHIGLHSGARFTVGRYRIGASYLRYFYLIPTVTDSTTTPPSNFRGSGANHIFTVSLEAAL